MPSLVGFFTQVKYRVQGTLCSLTFISSSHFPFPPCHDTTTQPKRLKDADYVNMAPLASDSNPKSNSETKSKKPRHLDSTSSEANQPANSSTDPPPYSYTAIATMHANNNDDDNDNNEPGGPRGRTGTRSSQRGHGSVYFRREPDIPYDLCGFRDGFVYCPCGICSCSPGQCCAIVAFLTFILAMVIILSAWLWKK